MENVDLKITDKALMAIAKKALARKTGARGLRAIMEELLLDLMYEIPDKENLSQVVIDEDNITKQTPVKMVYKKAKKAA